MVLLKQRDQNFGKAEKGKRRTWVWLKERRGTRYPLEVSDVVRFFPDPEFRGGEIWKMLEGTGSIGQSIDKRFQKKKVDALRVLDVYQT